MNGEAVLDLVRLLTLVGVFGGCLWCLIERTHNIRMVFFTLAIASIMMSDWYWMIYDILRPDARMPFAANELAEWAMFLLLGASLIYRQPVSFRTAPVELLCAIAFAGANVAFWIGWSGEWIQDILTGAVYAYLLCAILSKIKQDETCTRRQWIVLGNSCLLLVAGQTATFLAPETIKDMIDFGCYVLMNAVALAFLVNVVISFVKLSKSKKDDGAPGENAEKLISMTYANFAWSVAMLYMSEGIYYLIAMALSAIGFILMFLSLVKEGDEK